jgi:hypothetical protein
MGEYHLNFRLNSAPYKKLLLVVNDDKNIKTPSPLYTVVYNTYEDVCFCSFVLLYFPRLTLPPPPHHLPSSHMGRKLPTTSPHPLSLSFWLQFTTSFFMLFYFVSSFLCAFFGLSHHRVFSQV